MNSADMAFLVPDPDELLALPIEEQGRLLLKLLAQEHSSRDKPVAHSNFFNRQADYMYQPKYGSRQREVDDALMDAWSWLEGRGLLTKAPSSGGGNWVFVGKAGKEFLAGSSGRLPGAGAFIADSRLAELRALSPAQFDFRKLIRLCEELNTAYREKCYFATAMLTRSLLDHVPPLFGMRTFSEVTNNYGGGGKSFKDMMHHLDDAARKVADAHLHIPIRKSETLPVAQQVNFSAEVDTLLSEIVRITR